MNYENDLYNDRLPAGDTKAEYNSLLFLRVVIISL